MSTANPTRWRGASTVGTRTPTPVRVSDAQLVDRHLLDGVARLPLVMRPASDDIDLAVWTAAHRHELEEALLAHGGILFRGFQVPGAEAFFGCARAMGGSLLDYAERAAPRRQIHGQVYTSTELPADQEIPLHHEMSYSHAWPLRIWFYCDRPSEIGGRTPIADDRVVIGRIDPSIRRAFLDKQVCYVRNFGRHLDLPWQEAFQTESRADVERYCQSAGMTFTWRPDGGLRTMQVRPAVATHPRTGDVVWFNHAHLFHSSNLESAVRDRFRREFAPEDLPRNAFFGDGTPIEDAVLDEIRAIYRETAVAFAWQQQDVLMLDNVLTSHGRETFQGPRRILVAMADLHTP
jgi:alpha-ketoglutarate-dependent taurine dioxygenase